MASSSPNRVLQRGGDFGPMMPLGLRYVAFALWGIREREQFQLMGLIVEPEFKAADVAAIHRAGPGFGLGMRDRGPTRRTVPWH